MAAITHFLTYLISILGPGVIPRVLQGASQRGAQFYLFSGPFFMQQNGHILGVAQTVSLQTVFLSSAKRGHFDENGENDEYWEFPNLVVLIVCKFHAEALFCALLRSFAPLCALLRTCVCARLRSFALFCVHTCCCVRPRLERPRLGTAENLHSTH